MQDPENGSGVLLFKLSEDSRVETVRFAMGEVLFDEGSARLIRLQWGWGQ
jgi:hypothetical protein